MGPQDVFACPIYGTEINRRSSDGDAGENIDRTTFSTHLTKLLPACSLTSATPEARSCCAAAM